MNTACLQFTVTKRRTQIAWRDLRTTPVLKYSNIPEPRVPVIRNLRGRFLLKRWSNDRACSPFTEGASKETRV